VITIGKEVQLLDPSRHLLVLRPFVDLVRAGLSWWEKTVSSSCFISLQYVRKAASLDQIALCRPRLDQAGIFGRPEVCCC